MVAECQMLLLPLDVNNFRDGTNVDMKIFWYIIYMASFILIVIILPLALFYYESDEDKSFVIITLSNFTFRNSEFVLLLNMKSSYLLLSVLYSSLLLQD